jgi:hypothetical protein
MKQSLGYLPLIAKASDLKKKMDEEELRAGLSVQQEIQLNVLHHQELQMLRDRVLHEAMIRREIASLRQQGTSGLLLSAQQEASSMQEQSMIQQLSRQSVQDEGKQRTLEEALLVESLLLRKRTLDDFAAASISTHPHRRDMSVATAAMANAAPALMEQTFLLQQLQEHQKLNANRNSISNPFSASPKFVLWILPFRENGTFCSLASPWFPTSLWKSPSLSKVMMS